MKKRIIFHLIVKTQIYRGGHPGNIMHSAGPGSPAGIYYLGRLSRGGAPDEAAR